METLKLTFTNQPGGQFGYPATLPLEQVDPLPYAFLVAYGESISAETFAARIRAYSSHPRCQGEATIIERWAQLMDYALDHLTHFQALPMDFEYDGVVYDYDECLILMGERAVDTLLAAHQATQAA